MASGTPRSRPTRGSGRSSRRTGSPSTRRPARSAQLVPYVGAFSARTAQIRRNIDRYEAAWRSEHPGEEPGPRLREAWDRRAWAQARPDKVVPKDGRELVARWNGELRDLGYRDPAEAVPLTGTRPGWIDRDAAAELVVSILGAKRSAWNTADIRGKAEVAPRPDRPPR